MPRVLTVGATGYLGQAVTLSLVRRGGHVFYGLARSEANARSLAQLDIIPVLCSDLVNYPAPLLRAIETEYVLHPSPHPDKSHSCIISQPDASR